VAAMVAAAYARGDVSRERALWPDVQVRLARARAWREAPGQATEPASMWADGRALYTRPVRLITHLVEGLIPDVGTVLATGEDKAGKTTIGALLVLSYIHGLPFLGRAVPRPGRAIIVSEEDNADELRDRMRAMHAALARDYPDSVLPPDDPATLTLVADRITWEAMEGFRLDDAVSMASLIQHVKTVRSRQPDGPPVLVFIDSLQAIRGLLDPTKTDGVAHVKLALRQLHMAGAVVLLVAHARKIISGGKRTARASQEIAANHELAASAAATLGLMAISARPDAPVRLDLITKRGKSGVVGYLRIVYDPPNTWPPDTITVTVEETPAAETKLRTDKTDAAVLEALRTVQPTATEVTIAGDVGLSLATLCAHTKRSDKTVRLALDRLMTAKLASVVGKTTKQAMLYRTNDAEQTE
jgi:hypothetical protein